MWFLIPHEPPNALKKSQYYDLATYASKNTGFMIWCAYKGTLEVTYASKKQWVFQGKGNKQHNNRIAQNPQENLTGFC